MTVFWVYALLGPGLWLLVVFGLVASRVRMGKMMRTPEVLPDSFPSVAIVIPARNEGAGIVRCLESVLAMSYPGGQLTVIAVDDRSTDDTAVHLEAVAARDGRLKVLRLTEKPDDWLGKCHALHKGVGAMAPGVEWILFVDSDVVVKPEALRRTMSQALSRGVDAVSVLTRQRCDTFIEKLVMPVACAAILGMYLASITNQDNRKRIAFANGQFFLIRRAPYEQVGGHESVKDFPCEDLELMKRLKASGAKCRLYSGELLAETRMYDSVTRMFKGWGRIYSGASLRRPWRILIGCGFVVSGMAAFGMVPWVMLGGWGGWWVAAAWVHWAAVVLGMGAVYRWSGNAVGWALLFPLAGAMQLAFYAYALWWCVTNRMVWRGTAYSMPSQPVQ